VLEDGVFSTEKFSQMGGRKEEARARQRIGRKEWLVLKCKDEMRGGYGCWKRRSRLRIRDVR